MNLQPRHAGVAPWSYLLNSAYLAPNGALKTLIIFYPPSRT